MKVLLFILAGLFTAQLTFAAAACPSGRCTQEQAENEETVNCGCPEKTGRYFRGAVMGCLWDDGLKDYSWKQVYSFLCE